MSETTVQPRSNAPLWVIAALLAVVIVAGGGYLLHQHDVQSQRDGFRDQAGYYCTLTGNAPADADESYLQSAPYKRCVENRIDVLVGEANN